MPAVVGEPQVCSVPETATELKCSPMVCGSGAGMELRMASARGSNWIIPILPSGSGVVVLIERLQVGRDVHAAEAELNHVIELTLERRRAGDNDRVSARQTVGTGWRPPHSHHFLRRVRRRPRRRVETRTRAASPCSHVPA